MTVQVDGSISVSEAASQLGLSEKTIRRRIKAGSLPAFQVSTSQGFEWRVQVDGMSSPGVQAPGQEAVQVDGTDSRQVDKEPEPALLKALDLVARLQTEKTETAERLQAEIDRLQREKEEISERLHREKIELAYQVGLIQGKLQAAEEKILTLSPSATAEPEGPADRPKAPWWRRALGLFPA